MKTILTASLLLLISAASQAETTYRNADDSAFGEICIAALESRSAASQKAAELGVDDFDYSRLRCNGLSARSWVQQQVGEPISGIAVALNPGDSSPATELCLAALNSEQEFQAVKERHFGDRKNLENELQCNGKPLKRFVQLYEEKLAAL